MSCAGCVGKTTGRDMFLTNAPRVLVPTRTIQRLVLFEKRCLNLGKAGVGRA